MVNTAGFKLADPAAREKLAIVREQLIDGKIEGYYVRKEGNMIFLEVYPTVKREKVSVNDK